MTTAIHDLPDGELVGSYRIDSALANGGMGAIYAASHLVLPRRAAVKVLHQNLVGQHAAGERLLQEAQILETIAGPTVVQVYDAGVLADGRPWVAMELLEGKTLADLLDERGPLSALEVARIVLAVTDALAIAHLRGVVHCDIKPDNIIVLGETVKLIDWGIAHIANASPLSDVDTAAGTPQYMAPEQVDGSAIDASTDVYALGIVAYELLVGTTPFRGRTAAETAVHHVTAPPYRIGNRARGVPPALDELLLSMRARRPDERPSIDAVRERLSAIIDAMTSSEYAELSIEPEVVDVDLDALVAALVELEAKEGHADTVRMKWTPERPRWTIVSAGDATKAHGEFVAVA